MAGDRRAPTPVMSDTRNLAETVDPARRCNAGLVPAATGPQAPSGRVMIGQLVFREFLIAGFDAALDFQLGSCRWKKACTRTSGDGRRSGTDTSTPAASSCRALAPWRGSGREVFGWPCLVGASPRVADWGRRLRRGLAARRRCVPVEEEAGRGTSACPSGPALQAPTRPRNALREDHFREATTSRSCELVSFR